MPTQDPKILYQRELPGGGFVHVEKDTVDTAKKQRVRVKVERRTDPTRRDGHEPPVIATAEGESTPGVFGELLPIAEDNVEIAKALLKLQGNGKATF